MIRMAAPGCTVHSVLSGILQQHIYTAQGAARSQSSLALLLSCPRGRPIALQDWKIPPCISNWKNAKGYCIPLEKRLAADGRGLQEVQINDQFAKFAESLYVAESKARESVEMRQQVRVMALNRRLSV